MRLFEYGDVYTGIRLDMLKLIQSAKQIGNRHDRARATLGWNQVRLEMGRNKFWNSYVVLSTTETLVSLFLKNHFTTNATKVNMVIKFMKMEYEFSVQRESNGQGHMPSMRLGVDGYSVVMNKPTAHAFGQALRKAMNWISPEPTWTGAIDVAVSEYGFEDTMNNDYW